MGAPLTIDPALLDFATPRQREVLEAVTRLGSARSAARELGVDRAYPAAVYKAVKLRAARQGYSPDHDMTRTVPEGYKVRGVSTYYDSEGKPRGQWVKSAADEEAREAALQAMIEAACATIPRLPPLPVAEHSSPSLIAVYTFTDFHLGALAWHKEGGADWDVNIAERVGIGAMDALVSSAPAASEAIVNIQGDFTHTDGYTPATPASGHILDADSRFGKVADIAIRMIRRMMDLALLKHVKVRLIICEGNHDPITSLWLRKMFKALYEDEPRVTVEDSELPYYAYRFGSVMLAFHHGHLRKNDQLPLLFAAQFSRMWGETTKRYAHCGHRHHVEEREHSGMIVVQHPTIAARDAYAARGGWLSERGVTAITYHAEHGEVGRVTVRPEMIQ